MVFLIPTWTTNELVEIIVYISKTVLYKIVKGFDDSTTSYVREPYLQLFQSINKHCRMLLVPAWQMTIWLHGIVLHTSMATVTTRWVLASNAEVNGSLTFQNSNASCASSTRVPSLTTWPCTTARWSTVLDAQCLARSHWTYQHRQDLHGHDYRDTRRSTVERADVGCSVKRFGMTGQTLDSNVPSQCALWRWWQPRQNQPTERWRQ